LSLGGAENRDVTEVNMARNKVPQWNNFMPFDKNVKNLVFHLKVSLKLVTVASIAR